MIDDRSEVEGDDDDQIGRRQREAEQAEPELPSVIGLRLVRHNC